MREYGYGVWTLARGGIKVIRRFSTMVEGCRPEQPWRREATDGSGMLTRPATMGSAARKARNEGARQGRRKGG